MPQILVHLGAGIGNVVLATPLLIALHELSFAVDVLLAADYPETADLLRPWSVLREVFVQSQAPDPSSYTRVAPAIPPFYAPRFGRTIASLPHALPRPQDALFYEAEQQFYIRFAHTLGWPRESHPLPALPISASDAHGVTLDTLVIAPGCKTGEMAAKRWPHFPEFAEGFEDVAVVGTIDDVRQPDGTLLSFPTHVRSFVGKLTLRQTAELMAAAGTVVGNDSGLAHVAAAIGVPTVMIFGPTPHATLGPFPPNVKIIRRGLTCEPCWFQNRFHACNGRISCLNEVTVEDAANELRNLGFHREQMAFAGSGQRPTA